MNFASEFAPRLMMLIPLVLSLSLHEWAHAWSANKLGDDTAARMGRLTLNPLVHVDLIGTIALPLMGVPFGWAKPVPVDPTRFRRGISPNGGMALTAAAGPISNFILALVCAVVLGGIYRFGYYDQAQGWRAFLEQAILLNVSLGIFNLIPVPPLDGSRVITWFLPDSLQERWHNLGKYAPIALIAVFLVAGKILMGPVGAVTGAMVRVARVVAGA